MILCNIIVDYFNAPSSHFPTPEAIRASQNILCNPGRHAIFGFALREWRGDDPEGYFGDLGAWAKRRMRSLAVIERCYNLRIDKDSALLDTTFSDGKFELIIIRRGYI